MLKFLKNIQGATAIEYGLIAALIALAAVVGMSALGGSSGGSLNSTFGNVSNKL